MSEDGLSPLEETLASYMQVLYVEITALLNLTIEIYSGIMQFSCDSRAFLYFLFALLCSYILRKLVAVFVIVL